MLTAEQNELLTRVGPGTPGGELMRRYWHPVGGVDEFSSARSTKRVRVLGEDLVLFRDRQGRFGLIAEHCPHRRASLAYGIPTDQGIRCPYHGWHFDAQGKCLEQPNESAQTCFKERVSTSAYAVEELGGMLFAYMGPEPRPLLPRYDGFVASPAIRMIGQAVVPANWLQIMENSVDQVHTEWLHGQLHEHLREIQGQPAKFSISRRHVRIGFTEFEHGIIKRRLLEGQSEDCDDWQIGHPLVFPTMLAVGYASPQWGMYAFQIRTPMDDTHTLHLWYTAYVPPPGATVAPHLLERVPVYEVPYLDKHGEYALDMIDAQDIMAWVTQGPIADRTKENLGSTDQGLAILRRMVHREIGKVQRGEDPLGTMRDARANERIDLPLERDKHHFLDGFASLLSRVHARHSPFARELVELFQPGQARAFEEVLDSL
ncbi:aromatic ring-hydroxylating dioxygenase subunit alpha, partial [Paraburkholderia sp. RL18-101-BIB-B]|uniref:Rieske 2Fe-2S domain-containing protein n=1 Tax=unclassified Paraburkholderia TaxID=2615204 RepID=UPI0038BA2562